MPFLETGLMEQRVAMLEVYDREGLSVSALCRRFGVSRDTFYHWLERRRIGGESWFAGRSHRPHRCPHRTAEGLEEAVLALRLRLPHYGPKKLLARLERDCPETDWPAASTIGDILKRGGLIAERRRQRRAEASGRRFSAAQSPNEEWCVDFKGWFRTRDGTRVDPLTVSDAVSRYLIAVEIVPPTIAGAIPVFRQAFEAHGLPAAIRSDNGSPFGGAGAGGLTQLSVWWLKLGIAPHFIRPASPQQNGAHERMHRTLKQETAMVPADTPAGQQARFDRFRADYNEERPHEALGQKTPASQYRPSPRPLPRRIADPWYDASHQVRRVRPDGCIKWRGEQLFVSEALAGEAIGLCELDHGAHMLRFANHEIGILGHDLRFTRFGPPRPETPPRQAPK